MTKNDLTAFGSLIHAAVFRFKSRFLVSRWRPLFPRFSCGAICEFLRSG
jgi:hypothetical protein